MKKYIVEVYTDRTVWTNEAGQFHREDGPAVEWNNGYKEWYFNGKRHREDGPAVEWNNGHKEWWIEDEQLSESEFNKRIKQTTCEGKVVEIEGIKYKLTKV